MDLQNAGKTATDYQLSRSSGVFHFRLFFWISTQTLVVANVVAKGIKQLNTNFQIFNIIFHPHAIQKIQISSENLTLPFYFQKTNKYFPANGLYIVIHYKKILLEYFRTSKTKFAPRAKIKTAWKLLKIETFSVKIHFFIKIHIKLHLNCL